MTKAEAINFLDNIVAQVSMNRTDHITGVQAVETLKGESKPEIVDKKQKAN